ncbi:MAG: ATP synthase F1 subunit epsilon [Endomicrobia bacterium]|nr:ATP synthase F1 subunit epsilon [Endomicrobiia bacterium]
MSGMQLEILSPEGVSYKGEVSSIVFPTASGVIVVLPGHVNLVTKLKDGEIIIESAQGQKKITVSGGFAEILANRVSVVTEFAVPSDEANEYKIELAKKQAEEMKKKRKDFVDSAIMESELKRSVSELRSNMGVKRKKI